MTAATSQSAAELASLGKPRSKAIRIVRERCIMALLIGCAAITLGITLGIVFILLRETIGFFTLTEDGQRVVSVRDFFLGLKWNPLLGAKQHFGIWPLVLGTLKVTLVAMAFALPVGLISAIWLSEYAKPRLRAWIKPILEVLAGIPTVVFGFFAVSFITPVILQWEWLQVAQRDADGNVVTDAATGQVLTEAFNPLNFGSYNVMAAGLAVGIMCLPIVVSLSEDALRAVPRALREGSYGLGANKFETSVKVVVPAALSGVTAAFLLAIARAVGETMIVALAAGKQAIQLLTPAPDGSGDTFDVGNTVALNEPVQPMTGFIVSMFTGDVRVGSIEYYSSYAVAATLFVITLAITIIGNTIQKRFREKYD